MMVHIAETLGRQHGGLVLSVDALTKTVYMIYLTTPRFLTHSISVVHVLLLAVNRRWLHFV